jgi:hypothetical protein
MYLMSRYIHSLNEIWFRPDTCQMQVSLGRTDSSRRCQP